MPWQRYVLDVALEIDPATGCLAYRKVGLSVPRQQGKTETILTVMVHRIMAWERQHVTYTAQTRIDARRRWEDEFLVKLDESKLKGKYHPRKTTGNEAIIWRSTRSRLGITSTTEKAGHGPPLDCGMIDEAFAHKDDRVEQAMSPAMLTRGNAQMWWASAGGTDQAVFLNEKRKQGRELIERAWLTGDWPAVAYFEWYAPDQLRRDDPATWYVCMPALGYTVTPEIIRTELASLDASEFDRAYLNRTKEARPPADPNVPRDEWARCVVAESRPDTSRLAFAAEVSTLRDWSSISAASLLPDGRIHVELVDRRPGTDWVAPALARLRDVWDPMAVAIDSKGPVASLAGELAGYGITPPEDEEKPLRGDLALLRTPDVAVACGQFADAVRRGTVVHIDQPALTGAINGARTRPLTDAWAWSRSRSESVDISPLVAATHALWVLRLRADVAQAEYDVLDSVL
ncbi:terminase large subunit domain-containing protein [Streptomyces sp. NBC_01451]|uniref:terminase large subunit domain-containing protein n=1 Tax=Streptomyces sp. NBC_01451 TaxID=2903872 RepID=UPI002E345B56|nr:terminase family protein [Streptomyces sp. NBC_01451]